MRTAEAKLSPGDLLRLGEWVGVVAWIPTPDAGFGTLMPDLLGGPLLASALGVAERVARTNLAISLVGETGTGKERFARATHVQSGRRGPFVAVNCASLSPELSDSLLFGHARGAFTGATTTTDGHFHRADAGTLFLDEVLDLPRAVQPRLLRVLEDGEVQRVGETRSTRVDVRVITASQRPLAHAAAAGSFRDDLKTRLEGAVVAIPALRERREDVPFLFRCFLGREGSSPLEIEAQLIERLCLHSWPGNVRELEQLARRLHALHGVGGQLLASHLPDEMGAESQQLDAVSVRGERAGQPAAGERSTRELEALHKALQSNKGNLTQAAAEVGLHRQRAYRLLEQHGVDVEAYRDATLQRSRR